MKPTHTQGPWLIRESDGPRDFEITSQKRIDHGITEVCSMDIHFEGEVEKEQRANARLIAAAVIPADLYASEINFEISTFWDGGYDVKLGDGMNGYKAEDNVDSYVLALEQLRDWAITHFPESEFAKKYAKVPA